MRSCRGSVRARTRRSFTRILTSTREISAPIVAMGVVGGGASLRTRHGVGDCAAYEARREKSLIFNRTAPVREGLGGARRKRRDRPDRLVCQAGAAQGLLVRLRQRAADRAPVAHLRVCDPCAALGGHGNRSRRLGGGDISVGRQSPNAQPSAVSLYRVRTLDSTYIHEVLRSYEAQLEQWHESLSSRDRFSIAAESAEQLRTFAAVGGPMVMEVSGIHGS